MSRGCHFRPLALARLPARPPRLAPTSPPVPASLPERTCIFCYIHRLGCVFTSTHPHPVFPPGNAALMAPANGLNGVLPVAALHKNGPGPVPPARGPRAAQPRLKLVCRRLPPGLTKGEFEGVLGEQWRVGAGKVDWLSYKKGSVSTEYARPLCIALPLTFVQCCQTLQARPRLPPCHQARPRQASRRPHPLCHIP